MLEINGLIYYIDLDELSRRMNSLLDDQKDDLVVNEYEEKVTTNEDGSITGKEYTTKKMLNAVESKFKTSIVVDECLRTVLTYRELLEGTEEYDDTKEPTSYKLAFNTLLMNGIIKEYKIK